MATCSLVVMTIKPGTFTTISPLIFSSWKIILDTQAQQNAAMPPNSHTYIQYKFLSAISIALNFWSNLILTLVPRISTKTGRHWPSQSLLWGLFTHCFHVCLRKRLPQERSCLYLSCKAQTHCWHFSMKKFLQIFLFVPYRTECSL